MERKTQKPKYHHRRYADTFIIFVGDQRFGELYTAVGVYKH